MMIRVVPEYRKALPTENLLEDTGNAAACCPLLMLRCALLMIEHAAHTQKKATGSNYKQTNA